jgi:heptosyltransferase-2
VAHSGIEKALIVGPAWVGDMVMAHTLVQLLARRFDALYLVAPKATVPVGRRMPEIDHVFQMDIDHGDLDLTSRWRLGREIAQFGCSEAYVLPNSWKSALLPLFAGIERRVGWHGEARFGLLNDRRRKLQGYSLLIERYMALSDPGGVLPTLPYPEPCLTVNPENREACLSRLALDPAQVVALCPGAEFGAAKKWPADAYTELARALMGRGKTIWLMGSPADAADCAKIAERAPGVHNLAGQTTLADAIDLLSVCEQVVSNDSGLMHIGCALGIPTMGIFGSTSPAFTPPLGRNAQVVEVELACRPCFQRECPLEHLNCLRQVTPTEVLARLSV